MRLSNECCSKLRTLLLSFFLLTISLSAFGFNSNDDNDYVTVFKAGDEVCTPITIKTPYGTYTLTSELRIPKALSWWEAFDCQNRKIMDTGGSVSVGTGQTTIRTYEPYSRQLQTRMRVMRMNRNTTIQTRRMTPVLIISQTILRLNPRTTNTNRLLIQARYQATISIATTRYRS